MSGSAGSQCILGPLRFQPLLKRAIWGGRRLETVLRKPLGPGDDYAESWELCDHGTDQSIVADGPCRGQTLGQLVKHAGADLLGRHAGLDRFPLLVKWIDAHDYLSVQVHPNDQQAAAMLPGESGKTEAWVVLAAEPRSRIYAGLKSGVGRKDLEQALAANRVAECLHHFEPRPGDSVLLPAGTVHGLGAGILLYEVQQTSDVTFRLYDWDRTDRAGNRRPLHVAESLEVIDFARGPIEPRRTVERAGSEVDRETLVECAYFVLDRYRAVSPTTFALGGDDRFHVLTVFEGRAELCAATSQRIGGNRSGTVPDDAWKLNRGDTILLPACGPAVSIESTGATLLDTHLPSADAA